MGINTGVFEQFPVLKTERLTLREIRTADAEEIFAMRANGRVNQFIAREPMDEWEDARTLIEKTTTAFLNRQGIGWAGVLRKGQHIIGTCGFNHMDFEHHRAELGGELSVDYWGKHIAVEAVKAIVRFGLDTMHLHAIEAKVSPQNRGAIFLLQAIGFTKEAHFKDRIYHKGRYLDLCVYTLIKGNENR